MATVGPRLTIAPRTSLELKVAPGLVQMVTLLQLNRLELKEVIDKELELNVVLEEASEAATEELSPEELLPLLEQERDANPSDKEVLANLVSEAEINRTEFGAEAEAESAASRDFEASQELGSAEAMESPGVDTVAEMDSTPMYESLIEPGHKSPAGETIEKPSYETFLSSPVTLSDHLEQQLSWLAISDNVREAAFTIIGNLDEIGYLRLSLQEIAELGGHDLAVVEHALHEVHGLEPAGIGARSLQECLLLQLEARNAVGGVAWQIVSDHMKLLETKQKQQLAKVLGRPLEHIEIALSVICKLDPRPGQRYSDTGARHIVPDVYIIKDGAHYLIQLNDEELPQLRLSPHYKHMLDRDQNPDRESRKYIQERYASALQLIKNIEQRRQTILRVAQSIVERQPEFLESGLQYLRPMMIKEVAEEIGVHPSTVSRAVANKFAHTPQGVFELRYFFSEAVQGPSGAEIPLTVLKMKVKKMIDEENSKRPLTDDQIARLLKDDGIHVTRRTVAKYREDMKIPSTHHRRVRD